MLYLNRTAIERIDTYSKLPVEKGYACSIPPLVDDLTAVDSSLTKHVNNLRGSAGALEISNLSVGYRTDLLPVLRKLNISIPAGTKIGVVGRTGRCVAVLCATVPLVASFFTRNTIFDLTQGVERAHCYRLYFD